MRNIAIMSADERRSILLRTIITHALALTERTVPQVYRFLPAVNYLPSLYSRRRDIALTIFDDKRCQNPLELIQGIKSSGSKEVIVISHEVPAPPAYLSWLGPTYVIGDTLENLSNRLPATVLCLLGFCLPKVLSIQRQSFKQRGHWRRSLEKAEKFKVNGHEVWVAGYSSKTILTLLLEAQVKSSSMWVTVETLSTTLEISRAGVFCALSRLRESLAEQTQGKGRDWIQNRPKQGYRLIPRTNSHLN